jgi:hypothetical protein
VRFKIRFTKEFTLDVEAADIDAAIGAGLAACRTGHVEEMAGEASWGSEVWTAPDWQQNQDNRPHALVRGGVLVHPTDPEAA